MILFSFISDCEEIKVKNQVESLIKDYPKELTDDLRKAFAKLNSLGDHVKTVHIHKKSRKQSMFSDLKNIENSVVDQSESYHEKINQSESNCEENLPDSVVLNSLNK